MEFVVALYPLASLWRLQNCVPIKIIDHRVLISSKYYLLEREEDALVWVSEYPAHFANETSTWNYIINVARRENRGPAAGPALQSILARLDAPLLSTGASPSSSSALATLSDPVEPTPVPLAAPPAVAVKPPMIVGGPQPAGYVLAGQNQGMPLWVESSLVSASVMHARMDVQPGNVMGSQE